MMKLIRTTLRVVLLLIHVLLGIVFALVRPLVSKHVWRRIVQWWLRAVIWILGGRVSVTGTPLRSGALLVANHVAWLDIPLLGGYSPIRFLSKHEVKNWPVLGWLANSGGTLYIERGKQGAAQQAADSISDSLDAGDVVLVFPEGTTSDGREVRPFHARLFASALDSEVPVQPVAIRYRTVQGEVCDKVPYIDEMTLLSNLLGFLGERSLHMEVHYMSPINVEGYDRKALAGITEQRIREIVVASSMTKS